MIGLIVNLNAKSIVADPQLPQRLAQLGGKNILMRETRDVPDIQQAIREFAEKKVGTIAACGGDGTNLGVLTEMIKAYGTEHLPAFAILRGGTVNTVATNLAIKGSPEEILTRLVGWHNRGTLEPLETHPLLCINNRYGFFFGSAMASKFFKAYYKRSHVGIGWASVLAAKTIFSCVMGTSFSRWLFEPLPARIIINGTPIICHRWTLLVASTLMDMGLNFRITYRAIERDDHFHLVASGESPFNLVRQIHKVFMARPLSGQHHYDVLAKQVTIEFEKEESYIVDGDIFTAHRVDLTVGPKIKLSVP